MSAHLAKPCGDACVQGVKHSGASTGEFLDIGGVQTYVAFPPSKATDKVILFYTDVFGPYYLNNQLIMDFMAEQGYFVVAPDYFEGDVLEKLREDEKFDFQAWITKKREVAADIVDKHFLPALKEKYGSKLYACVGYCFGGADVLRTLNNGNAIAGAVVHPAFIKEEDFEKMKTGALFLSCAETDNTFPVEGRHKAEEILAANKANYHFQLFSGVSHGFAIRGDPNNENERWAKEQSAWGITGWFNRWLK